MEAALVMLLKETAATNTANNFVVIKLPLTTLYLYYNYT